MALDSSYNSAELESTIAPYREKVDAEMNHVIGYSDSTLVKYAPESPLGNFAADVVYKHGMALKPALFEGSNEHNTFSLLNFGGLRAPISNGDITVGNVYELMPFDNTIVLLKLSPEGLVELLSYLYQMNGQPIGNARCILEKSKHQILINGTSHDLSKPVYVITSNYLASGGDKMTFFKGIDEKWDSGILIRDVFINYIKEQKRLRYPAVSNRIEIIK